MFHNLIMELLPLLLLLMEQLCLLVFEFLIGWLGGGLSVKLIINSSFSIPKYALMFRKIKMMNQLRYSSIMIQEHNYLQMLGQKNILVKTKYIYFFKNGGGT